MQGLTRRSGSQLGLCYIRALLLETWVLTWHLIGRGFPRRSGQGYGDEERRGCEDSLDECSGTVGDPLVGCLLGVLDAEEASLRVVGQNMIQKGGVVGVGWVCAGGPRIGCFLRFWVWPLSSAKKKRRKGKEEGRKEKNLSKQGNNGLQ